MSRLLRTRSIDALIAASEEPAKRLRKTLGPWSLTAFGIGAVIGSGIFTLTGTAAAGKVEKIESIFHATILDLAVNGTHAGSMMGRPGAGPAITISFLLVAVACLFAGLCYAELASMIPIAGSAYTYAYAILGEIFAWIIGWDLILEYAVSNMSVAVGFSAYMQDLGDNLFGIHLPAAIAFPMFAAPGQPSGMFNIPALLITLGVTWVLVRGVRESAGRQYRHGADQDRRDRDLLSGRRERHSRRELEAVRAARILRHSHRRFHRLFHVYRLRFRFHGRRRMQKSAARSAHRDHRHPDRLHDSLWLRGAGAHRHRPLRNAEQRFARWPLR